MYGKLKQLTGHQDNQVSCETVVGCGSRMKGEIVCKGPSRIAGHVEGDLIGDDQLIISADASIIGQVTAVAVEINGKVEGTITASNRLVLTETASVEGDLHAPSVVIEEGARFNGTSHMPRNETTDTNNNRDNVLPIDSALDEEKTAQAG